MTFNSFCRCNVYKSTQAKIEQRRMPKLYYRLFIFRRQLDKGTAITHIHLSLIHIQMCIRDRVQSDKNYMVTNLDYRGMIQSCSVKIFQFSFAQPQQWGVGHYCEEARCCEFKSCPFHIASLTLSKSQSSMQHSLFFVQVKNYVHSIPKGC